MSDECYICLEETKESSCENGCVVHDACLKEGIAKGMPLHCTICKSKLRVTTPCHEKKWVQEMVVFLGMISQIMLGFGVFGIILFLCRNF